MISRILKSIFFKKATGKAGRYAANSATLFELAKEVVGKLKAGRIQRKSVGVSEQRPVVDPDGESLCFR